MDFRQKKKYGQNFLRDQRIVERILTAADLQPDDRVLEIGPGLGVLTDRLLATVAEVVVMEVDAELVERLRQRPDANLQLHAGDALRLDWMAALQHPPYKLVANLPYNISSQVVFRILEHPRHFSRLVLMFQKEVADRLCASPATKEYGILSVLCRLWFDIRQVTAVPPGAFSPPPKVTSAVLLFEPLPAPRVPVADEQLLRQVVKAAFGQRRKTLRNALAAGDFSGQAVEQALLRSGIDPVRRGETLSLAEFAHLSNALREILNSEF
ncbi:MAG: 16S rRNA (adenine(1518)-N(6)/adenine(1519)-N(6))-dimethyltransferase RsmA [Desulfuromonadales bacterium]|nr:16S rRNA (adenine(1518)-N(6)/adenine(1519)-N(6))-dimethyltransferase RsmA [Desulfuromonadales bacterium]